MGITTRSEAAKHQNNDGFSRRGEPEDTTESPSSSKSTENRTIKTGDIKTYWNRDVFICDILISDGQKCLKQFTKLFDLSLHQRDIHKVTLGSMALNTHLVDTRKSDAGKVSENNGELSAGTSQQNNARGYTMKLSSGEVLSTPGLVSLGVPIKGQGEYLGTVLVKQNIMVTDASLRKWTEEILRKTVSSKTSHQPFYSPREPESLEAVDPEKIFKTPLKRKLLVMQSAASDVVLSKARAVASDSDSDSDSDSYIDVESIE